MKQNALGMTSITINLPHDQAAAPKAKAAAQGVSAEQYAEQILSAIWEEPVNQRSSPKCARTEKYLQINSGVPKWPPPASAKIVRARSRILKVGEFTITLIAAVPNGNFVLVASVAKWMQLIFIIASRLSHPFDCPVSHDDVFALANRYDLAVYDTAYLDLSMREALPFPPRMTS